MQLDFINYHENFYFILYMVASINQNANVMSVINIEKHTPQIYNSLFINYIKLLIKYEIFYVNIIT